MNFLKYYITINFLYVDYHYVIVTYIYCTPMTGICDLPLEDVDGSAFLLCNGLSGGRFSRKGFVEPVDATLGWR